MSNVEYDGLYPDHIEACIAKVRDYVKGNSRVIEKGPVVLDAVLRNLQVMAESTQRLSDPIKATEPNVPWDRLSGFRHRLVHDYFRIDTALVVRVIDEHLDELFDAVIKMKTRL